MEKRVLLLICDGLGDRPVKALGGLTPLQAARKENLDWLASGGVSGLLDIISPGIPPGSDTAHLALFGYDPYQVYTGRGPFEAAGVGLEVRQGDVAFRCNFATMDDKGRIVDRRAGRIKEGTAQLAEALDGMELEGVEVRFKEGTEHRAALLLRGDGLDPLVSDADPHSAGLPLAKVKPLSRQAEKTARVVNKFLERASQILARHPVNLDRAERGLPVANVLLPRGAGVFPTMPSVKERWGVEFTAIAGVALIKGICRSLGMKLIEVMGATGGLDTDMGAKMAAAVKALEGHGVVVVSIKATDVAGHDRNPELKRQLIERVDESLRPIRECFQEDWIIAVTADHTTSSETGDHSGDPVPLLVFGEGVRIDDVTTYDEVAAARGGLGRLRGRDLMPLLMDLSDKTGKFGA